MKRGDKVKSIILVGGGKFGGQISAVMESLTEWGIIGYVDPIPNGIPWLKYLGTDDELKDIRQNVDNAVVSCGQIQDSTLRVRVYKKLSKYKYNLPPIIAKSAIISKTAFINQGAFIAEHAIIDANVKIGKCCIINTGAIISHDCNIGDFTHVSISVTLAGSINIGNCTFIGMGANVVEEIQVGDRCFICANSFVKKDVNDNTYYKNPWEKLY